MAKIENKLAALKKEYEEKYAAELDNVKKDVEGIVENLTDILQTVADTARNKMLKGSKIQKLISILGGSDSEPAIRKTRRASSRKSRAELNEDAVKTFIGKGTKTKSELSTHFKGGNVKVIKFIDTMAKAKQLETKITKSKKNKDVTNYSVK